VVRTTGSKEEKEEFTSGMKRKIIGLWQSAFSAPTFLNLMTR